MSSSRVVMALALWCLEALVVASAAKAQVFSYFVTKLTDTADGACDADCSLREAIVVANTIPGPKNIFLGPGTHTLSLSGRGEDASLSGDLDVLESVTITGVGEAQTVIDAAELDRVLHIVGDATVLVSVRDLTLRGGFATGAYPDGGGGGVYNHGARLQLERVRIEGNRAESSVLSLGGGGVSTNEGTTAIVRSTIAGNVYAGSLLNGGGGVFSRFSETVIDSSTIYGNTSYGRGGGVMNLGYASNMWITNSTVSGNAALGDGGPTKVTGGGVFTDDANTYIDFCTITDNYSSDHAGGASHDGALVELHATILAGNHVPPGSPAPDCLQGPFGDPMIVTRGFNVVGDNSNCATFMPGLPTDIVGDAAEPVDPRLELLADNGGSTLTHALLTGSPAIDHVTDLEACLGADQRGLSRPFGPACDVGGFELTLAELSGTVTNALGLGIPGVTITATGSAGAFDVVSASDGSFVFRNLPAGTYLLSPSLSGFTFSPNLTRTVPSSSAEVGFRGYDRPPIVLVAGFSSAFGTAFPPVPTDLRNAGYYVREADLINLSDGHVPLMEANVVPLVSTIDEVKAETGQPRVVLVAHSMGGLVSRAYVEGPSYPGRRDVLQLFTFGTPHLGISPLWSDIVPFLSTALTAGTINNLTACSVMPGFCQMSRSGMLVFNNVYHRVPGVDYHILGGQTPMWTKKKIYIPFPVRINVPERTWHNALGWIFSALIPGPDDAFIETGSSLGLSGIYVDRYRTEEVHDSAFGHRSYFNWRGSQSQQSYARCLASVLVAKTTRTCGARQATPPSLLSQVLAEVDPIDEEPPEGSRTEVLWSSLEGGETVIREVAIPTSNVSFSVLWADGPHDFTLIGPDGMSIGPSSSDDELVQYEEDESGATYVLSQATPGFWRLVTHGREGSPPADIATFASFASPVQLRTLLPDPARPWLPTNSQVTLAAELVPAGEEVEVQARIQLVDGTASLLPLEARPDGTFAATYHVGSVSGLAHLSVRARGLSGGLPFELETREDFLVMSDDPILSGSFRHTLVPHPGGSPPYAGLQVELGLIAEEARPIVVAADLRSEEGQLVAHAVAIEEVPAGESALALTFSSEELFRSGFEGPLVLTRLTVVDGSAVPPVPSVDEDDVYTISSLDYRLFATQAKTPVVEAGGPYGVAEGGSTLVTASAVDPEGDPLDVRWDLDGDGIFESVGRSVSFDASDRDGPEAFTLRVRASDGEHSAEAETSLDVTNVAPLLSAIAPLAGAVGERLALAPTAFTDPGRADTHTATVDWGDGSELTPATVIETGGRGTASAEHVYVSAGSFDAVLCVQDDDGGVGCEPFEVTIGTAPDCSGAVPSRDVLWPPNHAFVPVTVQGVVDADGEPLSIRISSVMQDEAVRECGWGATSPDARGLGSDSVRLRAERAGRGNGRVYEIAFSATDPIGLSCAGTVRVSVPKSKSKAAVDDGAVFDSTARR